MQRHSAAHTSVWVRKPDGSCRPNVPCSKTPYPLTLMPSEPVKVAAATWSRTPNGVPAAALGVSVVVAPPVDPAGAFPAAVRPRRITAVAGADVQRDEAERLQF